MTTTTALVVKQDTTAELARLDEDSKETALKSKAPRTWEAYAADWQTFAGWCQAHGLEALPAAAPTVRLYLRARADEGRKVSTLARALVSISQRHKLAGLESPTSAAEVHEVMKGLRRELGTATDQKQAVTADELRAMVAAQPEGAMGSRDRALLTLGFAAALRRSELVALDVQDLEFTADGLVLLLRRSKTDQEGEGVKVPVPFASSSACCPVRLLRAWLDLAGLVEGPVLRGIDRAGLVAAERLSDKGVARAVKRAARLAARAKGLSAKRARELASRFGGHSLRAGLATTAARAGKSERAIMKQGRWRSVQVARRYIRDGQLFDDCAAAGLL